MQFFHRLFNRAKPKSYDPSTKSSIYESYILLTLTDLRGEITKIKLENLCQKLAKGSNLRGDICVEITEIKMETLCQNLDIPHNCDP